MHTHLAARFIRIEGNSGVLGFMVIALDSRNGIQCHYLC